MERVTVITGRAAPLMQANVDTDAIFPSRYMTDASVDLGEKLFANWRYDAEGAERAEFVLNEPRYRGARILVADANFGCGSSREQAVWALLKYGIRCVIAPSFAEIFLDNAFLNGLLPVQADTRAIADVLARANEPELTVDLVRQLVEVPGLAAIRFEVPPDRRTALLDGMDEISYILQNADAISTYEQRDRTVRNWAYTRG